jgi:transposase
MDLEQRIRSDHPLRTIRTLVDEALSSLDGRFGEIYSEIGRPSIPPEQLLRAMLLQAFYSLRSERQLMERLDLDLLFRWFVGLGIDDAVWDASTFSKNRDRLLDGSVAAAFLSAVLAIPRVTRLLSNDHFSVDGTLIAAWAERSPGPRRAKLGGVASGGLDEEFQAQGRHAARQPRVTPGRAQP